MFNFQEWTKTFQDYYAQNGIAYNDAANYNVIVQLDNSNWKVIGIHHLLPDENNGNHNVYVEVLCKQNERNNQKVIHWTWKGRRSDEAAPDIWAGQKPSNELVNIPLNLGMIVSVWPHLGEKVLGLSSNHSDEAVGNTIGHHSFFVCFQEIDGDISFPDPLPEPKPLPEPPSTNTNVIIEVKLDYLNSLSPNDQGDIILKIGEN